MAKKAATSHMNQTERVAGTIFFIVYLLVLPLLAMWAATLLPEGVRGAMNQATQAAPAGESYLNLLPQADEHDRAVFLSRYFGLENKD